MLDVTRRYSESLVRVSPVRVLGMTVVAAVIAMVVAVVAMSVIVITMMGMVVAAMMMVAAKVPEPCPTYGWTCGDFTIL